MKLTRVETSGGGNICGKVLVRSVFSLRWRWLMREWQFVKASFFMSWIRCILCLCRRKVAKVLCWQSEQWRYRTVNGAVANWNVLRNFRNKLVVNWLCDALRSCDETRHIIFGWKMTPQFKFLKLNRFSQITNDYCDQKQHFQICYRSHTFVTRVACSVASAADKTPFARNVPSQSSL